jgi:hypothetical protein
VACVVLLALVVAPQEAAAGPAARDGAAARPHAGLGAVAFGEGTTRDPLTTTGPPRIPDQHPLPDLPAQGAGARSHASAATIPNASTNWAGEVLDGSQFTAVSSYWTVPAVAPASNLEAASSWIGIGGVDTENLIQTGTTSATIGNVTTYFAWFELIPTPNQVIEEPVSPGDEMVALIQQKGPALWFIGIEDVTKSWTATGEVVYTAGPARSAEWITERPMVATRFTILANFGTSPFHDLRFQAADPAATTAGTISMVDTTRHMIAYPGPFSTRTTGSFANHYGSVPPEIQAISPASGSTAGGQRVHITGQYLLYGLVTAVRFGSSYALFSQNPDGSVTAFAAPGSPGTVDITVFSTYGTSAPSAADRYTYLTGPAPGTGYDTVGSDGGVFVFSPPGTTSGFFGSLPGLGISVHNVVGMVPTLTDSGYFLVSSDGGVFAFGNAPFLGSLPGISVVPSQPITGLVATGTDGGYFLVGRDGGVFTFGNAPFLGSLPGIGVQRDDIVGIAATPSGNGYWLVAADGTVYGFGAAQTFGSATGTTSAVTAIAGTPDGGGYWIVRRNGSVQALGSARSFGTLPAMGVSPALPVIGVVPTADTGGYWLIGADGGIFSFGDAGFVGSLPGLGVHVTDIVGAAPVS